jgi:EAL domain-containing protein (putative c-di-GMP-specific phosphodiesterase class I)
LHVVAEGIETPAQLEALLKIDCDLLQGFFFGRPISLEQTLTTYKDLLIYSTPAEILERQAH